MARHVIAGLPNRQKTMHYRFAAAVTSRVRRSPPGRNLFRTQQRDQRVEIGRPASGTMLQPAKMANAFLPGYRRDVTRIEETRDERREEERECRLPLLSSLLLCSTPRRVGERDERGSSAPPCLCEKYVADTISYRYTYAL